MDTIKWQQLSLEHRSFYEFLETQNLLKNTDNNYDNTVKIFMKKLAFDVYKISLRDKNECQNVKNKFHAYSIHNDTQNDDAFYFLSYKKNENNCCFITFSKKGQIVDIIITNSKLDYSETIQDIYDKSLLELPNNILNPKIMNLWKTVFLDSLNKNINITYTFTTQDKSNLNINNFEEKQISQYNATFKKMIKKHLPEAYQYLERKKQEDAQRRLISGDSNTYHVFKEEDCIESQGDISAKELRQPQIAKILKGKKISLNNCRLYQIAEILECDELHLSNVRISNSLAKDLKCQRIIANNSPGLKDQLLVLQEEGIDVFLNGQGIISDKLRKKKENRRIRIENQRKEPIHSSENKLHLGSDSSLNINDLTEINNLGFKILSKMIPEIKENIHDTQQYTNVQFTDKLSNYIAGSVIYKILENKSNMSYLKVKDYSIHMLAFTNKDAKNPTYIFTDGSRSFNNNVKGSVLILDQDFNLHSLLHGQLIEKDINRYFNHEYFAYQLFEFFIEQEYPDFDIQDSIWFTDVNKMSHNYIVNIPKSVHYGKSKSFSSTLFIDGVCHQMAKDNVLEQYMLNPKNLIHKKENRHKESERFFLSYLHNNQYKIYYDAQQNSKDINQDNITLDKIDFYNPVENMISQFISFKEVSLGSISEFMYANKGVSIINSEIENVSNVIDTPSLHIGNSNIGCLAEDIKVSYMKLENTYIGHKPNIKFIDKKRFIINNCPDIHSWLPSILKENPDVSIIIDGITLSKKKKKELIL